MKPAKRLKRLEREIADLHAIELDVELVTDSGSTRTILRATIGALLDAGALGDELGEIPLAGVASRNHRIYLGRRRIV